jgi:small subunit ribosomal protein S2
VGTKFQAKEAIKEEAERCGQYYVNHRWLGGMLTNWKTVSSSIHRLKSFEEKVASPEFSSYTKKEQSHFHRTLEKDYLSLGGFREMGGLPNMLFVVDIRKDAIAVKEARLLGIPIVGIVDTNVNPNLVDYPIPGNDDGLRAIQLYCRFASNAVLAGIARELSEENNPEVKAKS